MAYNGNPRHDLRRLLGLVPPMQWRHTWDFTTGAYTITPIVESSVCRDCAGGGIVGDGYPCPTCSTYDDPPAPPETVRMARWDNREVW